MRTIALAATVLLVLAATTVLVAPTASAGCDPHVKGLCVQCVYGYPGDGCLITNPCDPRSCDPYWP